MKKLFMILFVIFFTFINNSCDNDDSLIQTVKKGDITGKLDIDESEDNSGAFVSLKGTKIVTTTDNNGNWTLKDVESGVYDIIFSKPGYDTTEIYRFQFAGNGTAFCNFQENRWATDLWSYSYGEWTLYSKSSDSLEITSVKIDTAFDGWMQVDTAIIFDMKQKLFSYKNNNYGFFFNDKPNVTKDNYKTKLIADWWYAADTVTDNRLILSEKNWEINNLFKNWGSGIKMYVVVYTFAAYEKDMRSEKIRWFGLGKPSNIVEFIVP